MTHNEALERAENLAIQRRRENRSLQWLFEQIEAISDREDGSSFFTEDQIWEMAESL